MGLTDDCDVLHAVSVTISLIDVSAGNGGGNPLSFKRIKIISLCCFYSEGITINEKEKLVSILINGSFKVI